MPYRVGQTIVQRFEIHRIENKKIQHDFSITYVCFDHEKEEVRLLHGWDEALIQHTNFAHHFKYGALQWAKLPFHPNIVNAYDVLTIGKKHFITLMHLPPDSNQRQALTDYISLSLPLKIMMKWAFEFCDAMLFLQQHQTAPHKNIHPDSLSVDMNTSLQIGRLDLMSIVDNSLAKTVPQCQEYLETHVQWRAPEQFIGNSSEQSDIYSFGIILYQLCNQGNLPFTANNWDDWQQHHQQTPIQPLDTPLWSIISKLLAKKTFDRFGETKPQSAYQSLKDALSLLWHKQFPDQALPTVSIDSQALHADLSHQQANALLDINRPVQALKHYLHALNLTPTKTSLLLNTGMCYAALLEEKLAARYYKKALMRDPKLSEGFFQYGLLCKKSGHHQHALNAFKRVCMLDNNQILAKRLMHQLNIKLLPQYHQSDPEVLYQQGLDHWKQQQTNDAILQLTKCIQITPSHNLAHYYLGNIYEQKQVTHKAYFHYISSLKGSKQIALAYYKIAHLLKKLGIFDEAASSFQTFLTHTNQSAEFIADARYQIPKMIASEEQFQRQTIYPEAIYNRALSLLDLGRLEEAKDGFNHALAMRPAYAAAVDGLGQYFEQKGNTTTATTYYLKAIELDSGFSFAWYHLGCLHHQQQQPHETMTAFHHFIQLAPTNQQSQLEHAQDILASLPLSSNFA